ncbi:MAG: hypothetical protein KKH40_04990, partial [Nanoarchaeota archaeon]|nr:hypothetical protein [Nanoarchaeota archaeon]
TNPYSGYVKKEWEQNSFKLGDMPKGILSLGVFAGTVYGLLTIISSIASLANGFQDPENYHFYRAPGGLRVGKYSIATTDSTSVEDYLTVGLFRKTGIYDGHNSVPRDSLVDFIANQKDFGKNVYLYRTDVFADSSMIKEQKMFFKADKKLAKLRDKYAGRVAEKTVDYNIRIAEEQVEAEQLKVEQAKTDSTKTVCDTTKTR